MKCTSCGSEYSVQPCTVTVFGTGVLQMILCLACRMQFQIAMWQASQKAA